MESANKKLNMSLDDAIKLDKGDRGKDRNFSNRRGSFRRNDQRRDQRRDHRPQKSHRDGNRNNYRGGSRRYNERSERPERPERQDNRRHYESDHKKKTRLRVENLHYNIGNNDLNELFASFGKLSHCQIDWDEIGRSKGTAVVSFEHEEDAAKAIKDLNDAELDGQILSVKYVEDDRAPRIQRRRDF